MAAKAPSDQARPNRAGAVKALDGALDRRRGGAVQVAKALVRAVEQRAQPERVAGAQRLHRLAHPLILAQHVQRPGAKRLGERTDERGVGVAEAPDPQKLAGAPALAPTRTVAAGWAGVEVALAAVQGHQLKARKPQ